MRGIRLPRGPLYSLCRRGFLVVDAIENDVGALVDAFRGQVPDGRVAGALSDRFWVIADMTSAPVAAGSGGRRTGIIRHNLGRPSRGPFAEDGQGFRREQQQSPAARSLSRRPDFDLCPCSAFEKGRTWHHERMLPP